MSGPPPQHRKEKGQAGERLRTGLHLRPEAPNTFLKPPAAGAGGRAALPRPAGQPGAPAAREARPGRAGPSRPRVPSAPLPHLREAPAGAEAVDLHLVEAGDLHGRGPARLFPCGGEAEGGWLPARRCFHPAAAAAAAAVEAVSGLGERPGRAALLRSAGGSPSDGDSRPLPLIGRDHRMV